MATSWRAAGLLLGVLAGCWRADARLREIPVPWPNDKPGIETRRRQNFCSVAESMSITPGNSSWHESVSMSGRTLSVVMRLDTQGNELFPFITTKQKDGATVLTGGLWMDILDEMAEIGDFTWRDSFALVDASEMDISDKNFSLWAIENYDVYVDWITLTAERTALGYNFLFPILDTSLRLIVQAQVDAPPWYEVMFGFLRPFSLWVWLTLVTLIILSAYVYQVIEKGQGDFEAAEDGEISHSLFLTAVTFTGGGGLAPGTWAGKFFTVMFTFMMLLVVSAYTANLASLLVVKGQVTTPVAGLNDAASKGMPICNAYDFITEDVLKPHHGLPVIQTRSIRESYDSLRDGTCKAATVREFLWEVAKGRKKFNPSCSLMTVGGEIRHYQSGWITRYSAKHDDQQCTAFVAKELNIILLRLYNMGTLEKHRKKHVLEVWNNPCPETVQAPGDADGGTMTMSNFYGIFGLQIIAMGVAMSHHHGRKRLGSAPVSASDESEEEESEMMKPQLGADQARRLAARPLVP